VFLLLRTRAAIEAMERIGPTKMKPTNVMITHWGRGRPQAVVGSMEPHRVVGNGGTPINHIPSRIIATPARRPIRGSLNLPTKEYFNLD